MSANDTTEVIIGTTYNTAFYDETGSHQSSFLNYILTNTNPMLFFREAKRLTNTSTISTKNPVTDQEITVNCSAANEVGEEQFAIRCSKNGGTWKTLPVLPTVLLSYEQFLETLCMYFSKISLYCQSKSQPYG